jgi:hypothetical protein
MKNSVCILLLFSFSIGCFNKKGATTINRSDISEIVIINKAVKIYKSDPLSVDTLVIDDSNTLNEIAMEMNKLESLGKANMKSSMVGYYDISINGIKKENISMVFTTFDGVVFSRGGSLYKNNKLALKLMSCVNEKYK